MNVKFLVLTLFYVVLSRDFLKTFFQQDIEENFIRAVESAVKTAFSWQCETIGVLQTKDLKVNDISSQVLRKNRAIPVCVENISFSRPFNMFCALIILNSAEDFRHVEANSFFEKLNTKGYFLLLLQNGSVEDATEIFKMFWKKKFYNVFVILETSNVTNALTFMPFSPGKCGEVSIVNFNQFDAVQNAWRRHFDFPKKFKNLHACQIVHATIVAAVIKSSSGIFRGTEIDIIETLGREMNFTNKHKVFKSLGKIDINGTGKGVLKDLYNGKVDISSGSLQLDRTTIFGVSYPYLSDSLILIVPPGALFLPFEKLYKTFSSKVWVGICLVFIVALILTKILPKNVLRTKPNQYLYFNMLSAFFGVSIPTNHLPTRQSTRFSLTIFLLYAMIIRTVYMAILFEYLRSEIRHKQVEGADEMVEKDFYFYAYETLFERKVYFKFSERFGNLSVCVKF